MLAAAFLAGISFSNSSSSASIVTLIFCASSKSESCSGIGMRMGPACLSASMSISRESMGLACQAWRTRLHFGHPCLSLLFGFSPVETSTFSFCVSCEQPRSSKLVLVLQVDMGHLHQHRHAALHPHHVDHYLVHVPQPRSPCGPS